MHDVEKTLNAIGLYYTKAIRSAAKGKEKQALHAQNPYPFA